MTKKFIKEYVEKEVYDHYRFASTMFKKEAVKVIIEQYEDLCKMERFKKTPRQHLLVNVVVSNLTENKTAFFNCVIRRINGSFL